MKILSLLWGAPTAQAGVAKWLAREAPCENSDLPSPLTEICLRNIAITLCFWEMVIENMSAEGVYLAMEQIIPP